MSTAGSLRKFTIEGIPYSVAADSNVSFTYSEFETSLVPGSGAPMKKMIKRIPMWESLVLLVNASEAEQIKVFSEQIADVKFAGTLASKDSYRSQGTINIESWETEEGRMTIQVYPSEPWVLFPAS